jgi:hypothetical protein
MTDYRCIYIHNSNATLTLLSPVIWISSNTPTTDDDVYIAIGNSAVNGTETAVGSQTTAPTPSLTFTQPASKAAGLALGDLPAGQHRAVWIRRNVNAGAAAVTNNAFTLRVEGDTQA